MFCFIALFVFSVLGIFSATHRELAKEALSCVFRRITLRPCTTGFKEKIRSRLVGRLAKHSAPVARIFNKYAEVFSWIFFLLMLWSTVWMVRGAVNFYLYGSCNGLNSTAFCLFDPSGENSKISHLESAGCPIEPQTEASITLGNLNPENYAHKYSAEAEDKLIFIGCYSCDYTRKAYPQIQKIIQLKPINYTFIHFPVKPETEYLSTYVHCASKLDMEKFWTLNDSLFTSSKEDIAVPEFSNKLVEKAGYDLSSFQRCLNDPATLETIKKQKAEIISTGLYGTPTIFINDKVFVGPKPERVYKRAFNGFWW